jgi:5-formyltetrahydrofolate cyclo-ligase
MLQRVWLGVNMNIEEKIKRINELYHKSQAEGLTEEEKAEQAALRAEYVANVRANLRGQLDHISIKEQDGSITNLGEQRAKRMNERRIE